MPQFLEKVKTNDRTAIAEKAVRIICRICRSIGEGRNYFKGSHAPYPENIGGRREFHVILL